MAYKIIVFCLSLIFVAVIILVIFADNYQREIILLDAQITSSKEDLAYFEGESIEHSPISTPEPTPPSDPFDEYYDQFGISEKIELLRQWYKHGEYFNFIGNDIDELNSDEIVLITSTTACNHDRDGYEFCHRYEGITGDLFNYGAEFQCLAFASFVSDFLFGKNATISYISTFDDISIGDHIRLIQYDHSMIVVEKGEDYVEVVEVNRSYKDCLIEWDRRITENQLYTYVYEVYRRNA